VREGRLVTPAATSGVLESITLDTMFALARELGFAAEAREVDRTELYVADELFVVGTGAELTPLVEIDGLVVGDGRPGPIGAALARAYHDIVRGIDERHPEWRTAVEKRDLDARLRDSGPAGSR
jgi:branched-chain amino acid aminotransferase